VKAVVQRVSQAAVRVGGETVAAIGPGLLVLLGVGHDDSAATAERLAEKVRALRIFADADGKMNEPLGAREVLCVSQFTLYADTAAAPKLAACLYDSFCEQLGAAQGRFGAHMEVELTGDGPVTIVLEVI
jgi:D-tyrosyl-tRNA(Tyr) deacylase